MTGTPSLNVVNLKTHFFIREGVVRAVDGVSFSVDQGEVLGIVGESGCGKSITARSILRLVPNPPGRTVDGRIEFEGKDLLELSESEMRKVRGNRISMIFQDPMTYLNPTMKVGDQITEVLRLHLDMNETQARARALELFRDVNIPEPEGRLDNYPHEFSGGMRQRVMIAMALACEPGLLIADEPTTALDVTVQAQILDLLRRIRDDLNSAIILITHDLGVVAEICDKVVVMYAGQVVEQANVYDLFDEPKHPYTRGLLDSLPTPEHRVDQLKPIPGQPPDLLRIPNGCNFAPRCAYCMQKCIDEEPPFREVAPGHMSRCWLDSVTQTAVAAAE
ncbi:ABC transporter ATP-binding protein [Thalassobaculum salexigens]|uniref:ABC transporter ATP-binding protein n=1 Tax=Thalassobaculum salexigens TaxID=455360 RepID=UPI00248D3BC5|nr:ABC transporter ATP-binding protein [Thalassobaculum salexigens]